MSREKKEKYQFFGSTEVRFKEVTNCPQKGYSLIEMIMENKRAGREKKSPNQKKTYQLSQSNKSPMSSIPGPGEYNPNDEMLKKSRGGTFFPHS
jgi:hypothetical protein